MSLVRGVGGAERLRVALLVLPGVVDDELTAFESVLRLVPHADVDVVGPMVGEVAGPGGSHRVARHLDDVPDPHVVVVPGGLGCRNAADDVAVRTWLRAVAPTCRWIMASSTGTVVLAAAGLLEGRPASTHWLATDLLTEYGGTPSGGRLAVSGNIVTCEGRISALDGACLLVERMTDADVVAAIRAQLLAGQAPPAPPARWWRRARRRPRARPNPNLARRRVEGSSGSPHEAWDRRRATAEATDLEVVHVDLDADPPRR